MAQSIPTHRSAGLTGTFHWMRYFLLFASGLVTGGIVFILVLDGRLRQIWLASASYDTVTVNTLLFNLSDDLLGYRLGLGLLLVGLIALIYGCWHTYQSRYSTR